MHRVFLNAQIKLQLMVLMSVGWMTGIAIQFWNRKEIFLSSICIECL